MATDHEQAIFEALWSLYAKGGATARAIRDQPALMGLSFVIAKAVERTGQPTPTLAAIADECRRCMIDAAGKLAGGDWLPLDRDNYAVAARILLGLEPGTSGTRRKQRRALLSQRLGMPEGAIIHMRNGKRYDAERLHNIAEAMALAEADHDGPAFACTHFSACLRLGPSTSAAIYRWLELVALRDNAKRFVFTDMARTNLTEIGSPGHVVISSFATPTSQIAHSYDESNLVHQLDFVPSLRRGRQADVGIDTLYLNRFPDSAYVRFDPENWNPALEVVRLELSVPPSIKKAIARIRFNDEPPEAWEIHDRTQDDHFEVVFNDVREGHTYELGYDLASAED